MAWSNMVARIASTSTAAIACDLPGSDLTATHITSARHVDLRDAAAIAATAGHCHLLSRLDARGQTWRRYGSGEQGQARPQPHRHQGRAARAVGEATHGIHANAVVPASLRTCAWDHRLRFNPGVMDRLTRLNPLGRLVTTDEVAGTAAFLATPLASGITGQAVPG